MSLTAEMVQVQFGVPGAFENLYKAHFPILRVFFCKLGFPPKPADRKEAQQKSWAEDLAHETLVAVWECRQNFNQEKSEKATFEAWSYGIAFNIARKEWKRIGRSPHPGPEFFQNVPVADHTLGRELVNQLLQRALDKLSPADRLCIVLIDMTGFGFEEAASALGGSISSVRQRYSRVREKLRLLLEGHFTDEGLVYTDQGFGSPQHRNNLMSDLTGEMACSDGESQGSPKASTKKGV